MRLPYRIIPFTVAYRGFSIKGGLSMTVSPVLSNAGTQFFNNADTYRPSEPLIFLQKAVKPLVIVVNGA